MKALAQAGRRADGVAVEPAAICSRKFWTERDRKVGAGFSRTIVFRRKSGAR
jgi:hypothetical protein